jgi:hypothetical protein
MKELDMNAVRSHEVNYDALQLGNFGVAYEALVNVLERRESVKKIRAPPGQTVTPVDATFSGGPVASKSSPDSKGELFVQKFANRFIDSSFVSLRPYLDKFAWMDPKYRACLGIQ